MIKTEKALGILQKRLSSRRYIHSLAVAEIARELAEMNRIDAGKAYMAGLLHDYARGLSGSDLLKIASDNNLMLEEVERLAPDLLHAKIGAFLLEKELGLEDAEMLQAVAFHTLGHEKMTELDKVIYIADMIEPGRDYPGIERLKCLAFRSLDEGVLFGLDITIRHCIERRRLIHPQSIRARNAFLLQTGYSC